MLAVTATMVAAGITFAAPAPADTIKDTFLAALNRAGIDYADPDGVPHVGRTG